MNVSNERCKITKLNLEIYVCGYGRRTRRRTNMIHTTHIRSTLGLEVSTYKTYFVVLNFDVSYL
jgi:hypothetical protein